ncbi:MAG: 6-bladed beta-propeller [Candidatus Aminicenantaceae bacterium]
MQFIRKIFAALMIIMMGFLFVSSGASEIKRVHSSLKEIQEKEGKLQLTLIREWSGEDEVDENKIFSEPKDVAISKEGEIYILDENRIQIFDKSGNYLRAIGRGGRGPGDLLNPIFLEIDKQNNLVIVEKDNHRIQISSSKGDYLGSFLLRDNLPGQVATTKKSEILMLNRIPTTKPSPLWFYYDYQGQILREGGQREGDASEGVIARRYKYAFSLDEEDNIYAAAEYIPMLQKYSPSGELQLESTFEVSFEVPEIKSFRTPEGVFVDAETVTKAMDIDAKGRIFLLTLTRLKNLEERKIEWEWYFMSRTGEGGFTRQKVNFDVGEKTDLYQILVFNNSGKIVASKKLDIYANNIRIYLDRLFLIDSSVNMMIYEYKISFSV